MTSEIDSKTEKTRGVCSAVICGRVAVGEYIVYNEVTSYFLTENIKNFFVHSVSAGACVRSNIVNLTLAPNQTFLIVR